MSRTIINSRRNALVQRARAARAGIAREVIFIEGVRLCEEAARAALDIAEALYTEKLARDVRGEKLLSDLRAASGSRLVLVSEDVLASVADTKMPQGIIALARRPQTDRHALESCIAPDALLIILHRINNPSNAGAMLRVAEAAGACGVIATAGSTDLLSPKALRGAMGSSFRLPLWMGADFREAIQWCAARGMRTISADLNATLTHTEVDFKYPSAIIVGAEGSGLTAEEIAATDLRIRIPMRPPVESLNVSVALAVVLYEAARQRDAKGMKDVGGGMNQKKRSE